MNDNKEIIVKESTIEVAVLVHKDIPEFDKPADVSFFEARYKDKLHVIFVAYLDEKPIGYMIAYDKFGKNSVYCWMAGVIPEHRQAGALKNLMESLEKWCQDKKTHTIHIKTRNHRRAMLNYLIKNGYNLTEVQTEPKIENNRILLQKSLIHDS